MLSYLAALGGISSLLPAAHPPGPATGRHVEKQLMVMTTFSFDLREMPLSNVFYTGYRKVNFKKPYFATGTAFKALCVQKHVAFDLLL